MPRIDPSQLLNTLSVLLAPDGGIRSSDDVSIFFFVIFTVDMTTLTGEPVRDRKDRTVRTETLGPFFHYVKSGFGIHNAALTGIQDSRDRSAVTGLTGIFRPWRNRPHSNGRTAGTV
jgi:hypothetical protein